MDDEDGAADTARQDWLNFQERLRVERERLGLTQEAFAGLGGVGKSSQWMYEQGRHWPTMEYVEALRARGVDVGYLASGLRLDWETLRHALGFVLRLVRQEGRNFSDEQLFRVFRAVIEASSGLTRPDLVDQVTVRDQGTPSEVAER